jgi:hypothetical protein
VVGGYGLLLVAVLAVLGWSDYLLAPIRSFTFTAPPREPGCALRGMSNDAPYNP